MPEYLTPGVYYERSDAAPPLMAGRTDVAGFVGLAERGPVGAAVRVDSWAQFQSRFGTFVPWAYLAYAVKAFFENGGRTCYVVRVAGTSIAPAAYELRGKPLLPGLAGPPVIHVEALDPGTWAGGLAISVVNIRDSSKTFSFHVLFNREIVESFEDVSIGQGDRDHPFFESLINVGVGKRPPSKWVRVSKTNPASDLMPDAMASKLVGGTAHLQGGSDGLSSLTVANFLGDDDVKTGLAALENVDAVAILAVPDIHVRSAVALPPAPPPTPPPHNPCCPVDRSTPMPPVVPIAVPSPDAPPSFSDSQVLRVQRAMIEQCERRKDRVAILEVPLAEGGSTGRDAQAAVAWRKELTSDRGFAALYHPWVKVVDPVMPGRTRLIPPSGHLAGIYARTDLARGVHKAPGNEEMLWAEDVVTLVDDRVQGVLNPWGVNALRAFPGRGIRCYGARTVSIDPTWRYVNVRRLMCMIEVTLRYSMRWTVFEPNDWPVRSNVVAQIGTFFETLWRRGALAGRSAEEAFFVRCDETNNTQADVDNGRLLVEVGVAPTIPAEFVVFRVGRTADELEIIEE